jgi:hypothetical protein
VLSGHAYCQSIEALRNGCGARGAAEVGTLQFYCHRRKD